MTQIDSIKFAVKFEDGTTKTITAAEIKDLNGSFEIVDSRGNVLMKSS